jgi:hypothetical protein
MKSAFRIHNSLSLLAAAACLMTGFACGGEAEERAQPASSTAADASARDVQSSQQSIQRVAASGPVTVSFDSPTFHVNELWKSMQGPSNEQTVGFTRPERPEILWLTGYRATIVGENANESVSQEFMCHNNLFADVKNPMQHPEIFGWSDSKKRGHHHRLFTLSQGQFEIVLPEGFGVPVRSDENILLGTQVLNHNVKDADLLVRHQTEVDYVRDQDTETPMIPLYPSPVFVMVSLEDTEAYFGMKEGEVEHTGSSCSVGSMPELGNGASASVLVDDLGQEFANHWVVNPGREVRHTLVTGQMELTFDTRIHLIGAHVHPFSVSLELRDLTTGESLYKIEPEAPETGIGLSYIPVYSSKEGIPLYQDHEYEIVSVYDNTSGVDQDAMATLILYLYDADAQKAVDYARKMRQWAEEAS